MRRKHFSKTIALLLVMVIIGTLTCTTPFKVKASEEANAIIVTTQKSLMKEIAKKSAATIILETSKSTTITMKSKVAKTIKRAKNKKVIIDAPNAKVRNYLKFKTLTIKNAKAVSERVNGNKITVQSATTKFSVYKNITVKKLTIPAYTQVTLGKKAKITTVKYTKTKPTTVTATPTEKPVVTTVPTTIPAPTETPTPVVVPTQTPVVTEVPTQAPTVTEAPTVTPTEKPKKCILYTEGNKTYYADAYGSVDWFDNTQIVWFDENYHVRYAFYAEKIGEYVFADGTIVSESELLFPTNYVKPTSTTPTVTESQSASPEVTATTTVTVQPTKVETTPEPTQEVEVTTTPEPTVTATVTPEPTVTAEPVPTEHVHSFTYTHFKKYKVKVLHEAEYTTEPVFECNNPDCRCKFYTIIDNADRTQSISYWTESEIDAHIANHIANKEASNMGTTYVSIISKAAYYTEEIKEICVCDICGEHCNTSYEIICEVD